MVRQYVHYLRKIVRSPNDGTVGEGEVRRGACSVVATTTAATTVAAAALGCGGRRSVVTCHERYHQLSSHVPPIERVLDTAVAGRAPAKLKPLVCSETTQGQS